jgi:hypothetical protein
MKKIMLAIVLLTSFAESALGQSPTVGLLWSEPEVSEGYTLFSPEQGQTVVLINNCGELINEWGFSGSLGFVSYLRNDGSVLRAGQGLLEIRDWNNNLVWSYETQTNGLSLHHDVEPLENGNILAVISETFSANEMIEAGRNPALVDGNFKLDGIVEIQPVGVDGAEIVWEWWFSDHLVQYFDSQKLNYGVPSEHKELLNINLNPVPSAPNWTHVNSIDYNAELDQIIFSSRNLSEVFIIDHSTSALEASGHAGGSAGKGGDILWRWGNPDNYGQAEGPLDKKLSQQHDAKWIQEGYLNAGSISVFNNGGNGNDFSSVHVIEPSIENGDYQLENGSFLPVDFEWTWSGSILGSPLSEHIKSGVQALLNGNVLICESSKGHISEITEDGIPLWVYRNPFVGGSVVNQYDFVPLAQNSIFRAQKYAVDYSGLLGFDLTPGQILENENNLSQECALITGTDELISKNVRLINPVIDGLVRFSEMLVADEVLVMSAKGNQIFEAFTFKGKQLPVVLEAGIYVIRLKIGGQIESHKLVVL